MRKIKFSNREFYHIFNRGVEKRKIFLDQKDLNRFFVSMKVFNSIDPVGSLFEQSFKKDKAKKSKPLVKFIAYCVLENHFHFILEQLTEQGISKFMKRLGGGYSWYFNNRYNRSGSLFQGVFKAKHIDSNEYLLHSSVYVNLNNKQKHPLGDLVAKQVAKHTKKRGLVKSSWEEYLKESKDNFCDKDVILGQFRNIAEYKKFALESLKDIRFNKEKYKGLEIEK